MSDKLNWQLLFIVSQKVTRHITSSLLQGVLKMSASSTSASAKDAGATSQEHIQ